MPHLETVYIVIEKNREVFVLYKALWGQSKVNGIMVRSMAEAIEKGVFFYGTVKSAVKHIRRKLIPDSDNDSIIENV